jgi:hypothetical protein
MCQRELCRRGNIGACKFASHPNDVDMQVAEWVKADDMASEVKATRNETPVRKDNTITSKEGWPNMVNDLIDL